MTDHTALDRLFQAIMSRDIESARACFTPSARVWHSYDCIAHGVEDFIASLKPIFASGVELRYDDVARMPTPNGFVQQYLLVIPSPEGGWTCKPCCAVVRLKDGLIDHVQEYLDRTGVFHTNSLPACTPGL